MKRLYAFVPGFLLFFGAGGCLFADVFTFKADRMTGGSATGNERTVLIGNAEVKSDNLVINADRIEIFGPERRFLECTGKVSGSEEKKEIFFKADRMSYDRSTKIAVFEGNSTLEDKKNEVVARGRYIEYNQNTEITVFQISVRLFKDNMVCRSEYAVYRRNENLLDLSGYPVVYKQDDEFRASRIRVDMDTNDVIMEGAVSGSIKATEKADKKGEENGQEDRAGNPPEGIGNFPGRMEEEEPDGIPEWQDER